jgi:hypothetical protein
MRLVRVFEEGVDHVAREDLRVILVGRRQGKAAR